MKNVLSILSLVVFLIACSKSDPKPVDPAISKFTQILTGTWNAKITQCSYPVYPNNSATTSIIGAVDCSVEQQWDYVKQMTITSDLKVTNTYYCSSSRTTYFELHKEKTNDAIIITEKDSDGNVMKIYTVNTTSTSSQLVLTTVVFDLAYFYSNKSGSIPTTPSDYQLLIEKQ